MMIDDKDFYDLKVEVKESNVIVKEFIKNTVEHRQQQLEKLSRILECSKKSEEHFNAVNNRCLANVSTYETFKQHIAEDKKLKERFLFVRKDKLWDILKIITTSSLSFAGGYVLAFICRK